MKRFTVFFCVLTVLLLLVACSENPGTTTMRLELSTESCEGSRTLLPSDSTLLDVTRYTVSGTGPNGKTFTRSADSSSVEIEGVHVLPFIQKNYSYVSTQNNLINLSHLPEVFL